MPSKIQTKADRVAMRHKAKFTSLMAVEEATKIPKDRIAKYEDKGAREARMQFFDVLILAKHYGVTINELVGENLNVEVGEGNKPEFDLSPLEAAIVRNCRRMTFNRELFFYLSEVFVNADGLGRGKAAISPKRLEEYEKEVVAHGPLNAAKEKHGLIPRSLKRQMKG